LPGGSFVFGQSVECRLLGHGDQVGIAAPVGHLILNGLFADREPTLLVDSQASEQQLHQLASRDELRRYRYLHLATQGDVDNRLPLQSTLILSRGA
jgi:hypothetical protein